MFDLGRNNSNITSIDGTGWINVDFKVAMSDGNITVGSVVWLTVLTRYFADEEISVLGQQFTLISSAADAVCLTLFYQKILEDIYKFGFFFFVYIGVQWSCASFKH